MEAPPQSSPAAVDEPISLPQEPTLPDPAPFPYVASFAPVLVSIVMWAVTRSPYVLVFAALGPVVAIGAVVDGRWSARRRLRRDLAAFERDLSRVSALIDERHEGERTSRARRTPSIDALLRRDPRAAAAERWRPAGDDAMPVVIGLGEQPSELRLGGPLTERTRPLAAKAAMVSDAPVVIDVREGVGVAGPISLGRAFARGIVLQVCDRMPPTALSIVVPECAAWRWTHALPHDTAAGNQRTLVVTEDGEAAEPGGMMIAIAENAHRLPPGCRHVIELFGGAAALLRATGPLSIAVSIVSESRASAFASELSEHARVLGLVGSERALPGQLRYDEIRGAASEAPADSLAAPIGRTSRGDVVLDLVVDGPHAIVGGTTGSGKSELLSTWVVSMAERYSPEQVTMLLVDFKGGAAFAPIATLPHVVGMLTDLNEAEAERALQSLRAELRLRERLLRDHGVRDIGAADGLARLVIVVDEFAAMVEGFPALHALFVDIAARGRSLGVHLILCTQRPAGVVRETLMANCGLRMSLRVNDRGDSIAIVGSPAAASLPAEIPGRLAIASTRGEATIAQVATVGETDVVRVAGRWADHVRAVRRPWLDPLPSCVRPADLDDVGTGIRLGLADLPDEQRRATAVYQPASDGSLLVIGAARAGKSSLLQTIEDEAMETMRILHPRSDVEWLWDIVSGFRGGGDEQNGRPTLLLIDDLDTICGSLTDDYAAELADGVVRMLRDGPRVNTWVVITAQRIGGVLSPVNGYVGSTLLMRLANRQEHLMAGGEPAGWVERRRPGSAVWRGREVQLAHSGAQRTRTMPAPAVARFDAGRHDLTVVVSRDPLQRADRIRAAAPADARVISVADQPRDGRLTVEEARGWGGPTVVIGDPDHWQTHWQLLAALRPHAELIVEGCTAGEFNAITRHRGLPPFLADLAGRAWHVTPSGAVTRVTV